MWFVGGLVLDLWAHSRGRVAPNEGFFTPWHIVFYLGATALAAVLVREIVGRHRDGATWLESIPRGYGYAAAGMPLFFVCGLIDFTKHTITGFDLAAEAPIDPSHLGIIFGMAMMVSGPIHAAWVNGDTRPTWRERWPAVISLAASLTAITLITLFSSPLAKVWADPAVLAMFQPDTIYAPSLAISGMLISAGLLAGFLLPVMRRGILPVGGFAAVMAINAALMTIPYSQYRLIPAAIAAGIVYDVIAVRLRGDDRPIVRQMCGAAIPFVFFVLYFLGLALMGRMGWPFHVWSATLLITAAAGWGVSLIMR
jgi:hypothetical protein